MSEITSFHDFISKHPMYHKDIARLLGVTVSAVDKWSTGARPITPRTLTQLNTIHQRFVDNPKLRAEFIKQSPEVRNQNSG